MDIAKMIAELRAEHTGISEAILVLERLSLGHGKRRGRFPAWMTTLKGGGGVKRRGRPPGRNDQPQE
jgi:hypothetical protein